MLKLRKRKKNLNFPSNFTCFLPNLQLLRFICPLKNGAKNKFNIITQEAFTATSKHPAIYSVEVIQVLTHMIWLLSVSWAKSSSKLVRELSWKSNDRFRQDITSLIPGKDFFHLFEDLLPLTIFAVDFYCKYCKNIFNLFFRNRGIQNVTSRPPLFWKGIKR